MPERMAAIMLICSQPETIPRRREPASSFIMPILAGLKNAAWVASRKKPARLSFKLNCASLDHRQIVNTPNTSICASCIHTVTRFFENRSDKKPAIGAKRM